MPRGDDTPNQKLRKPGRTTSSIFGGGLQKSGFKDFVSAKRAGDVVNRRMAARAGGFQDKEADFAVQGFSQTRSPRREDRDLLNSIRKEQRVLATQAVAEPTSIVGTLSLEGAGQGGQFATEEDFGQGAIKSSAVRPLKLGT